MNEQNTGVELDPISAERLEAMGVDAKNATHEEIMRFAAITSAHYLRKIRFWITLWSVVTLLGMAAWLLLSIDL